MTEMDIDRLTSIRSSIEAEIAWHEREARQNNPRSLMGAVHETSATRLRAILQGMEAPVADEDELLADLDNWRTVPRCRKAATAIRRLTAERDAARVERDMAREAIAPLLGAAGGLLSEAERTGAFDNLIAELFPDSERRGVSRRAEFKRLDAARNGLRSAMAVARAALTGDTPDHGRGAVLLGGERDGGNVRQGI